ncbi:glucose-6-phosphate dehydrogenase assembly protein OpcA [Actinoplanes italicus]|uniref:Glucose-6-phosphate dehydrogenase assembly protein OpcA n=1 Tax=Actinoplanes italicus TaxID=113567 RepID=A0A2T0KK81_9ACTN|nr:glucose-6-phosphate dehydrogenase assembly protein OpcA [Actinoplanes italicus]PRX23941.1 glucose-6-phosphate dehydrogenase assembly protein OpcA [Actinoplanes italicus]GIE35082.1 glucose-6-phosphate dehydrogenase assembly protein OpcA [Actinoplanes italicus]
MIGLWDTTGNEVVKALAAERRSAGGVASGLALTLIAVVEEKKVREAEAAATIAAAAHPCRLLIVVRSDMEGRSRLDAEIVVGGRLGPAEAVVMRMYGRLALHAESVVMPLLAPDVPVVTWWHEEPPNMIANDFLGVVSERRITDSAQSPDPVAALKQRAIDYAPGDTDLTWTRITLWRSLVAGAFDSADARVTGATIVAPRQDPTAWLMLGWLKSRLGIEPVLEHTDRAPRLHSVELQCENGDCVRVTREEGTALFSRTGQEDRYMPLPKRPVGDELAEELRRLDADQIYADALGAMAGLTGLDHRPPHRVHVWKDPALAAIASSAA